MGSTVTPWRGGVEAGRSSSVLATVASTLLLVAGPGPEERAWLQWSAPPQCPDTASLEESIADRLGREVAPGEIEVRGGIEDTAAAGYRLTLLTKTDAGEDRRELTAHDCRALADATALLVALTIDAVAVAQRVQAEAAREPAAVVPAPSQPALELEPEPTPEPATPQARPGPRDATRPATSRANGPERAPEVAGAIAGGAILGTLPGPSGGPELGIALLWPRLRIEVAGAWFGPRTEEGSEGARVRVQLGVAATRACVRLGTARVEAPVCGGLEIGALRGDGEGAPGARVAHGLWLAPAVGAGVRGWVTRRLAPFARLDVAIPVVHPAFELTGPNEPVELYRASAVSGRLWLGLEVKFSAPRDGSSVGRRRPG